MNYSRQRQLIWDAVTKGGGHPTAEELYQQGLAMLLEFLLNLTFGVHQTFFWSFYPLAAGVLLGVMLIIIAVCPPLRRSLHRKFFL